MDEEDEEDEATDILVWVLAVGLVVALVLLWLAVVRITWPK